MSSTTVTERTTVIKDRSKPEIWVSDAAERLFSNAELDAAERITVTVRIEKAKSPGERLRELHFAHQNRSGVHRHPRTPTWDETDSAYRAAWEATAAAVGYK